MSGRIIAAVLYFGVNLAAALALHTATKAISPVTPKTSEVRIFFFIVTLFGVPILTVALMREFLAGLMKPEAEGGADIVRIIRF